ncbi:alpha-amylase family glycosyl hydrolase [Ilumatobacter nonamiensis]|uniref:alpha-amylase family glycosyl hydrolase n=1 Tax=Ilumatobacter nonamiensis TaxID=467093 RepID=UPI000345BBC1|nr:alpha-amylase family glycosyl hydrolase [Ilumatobacter nonamiensis]
MSSEHWWQNAVVYQVYVRSFADSDGDGVGDLAGIRSRLDHLVELGIDAVWLNPCYPSPQFDHGYDVADYFGIHAEYGDLAAFDELLAAARDRGIKIMMDLVPNHCSSQHRWFVDALAAAPGSRERARFYFRDGRPDGAGDAHGAPPNNWSAAFGGSAWTRPSADDSQWYLGTFTPHQPDFDHTNPDVQAMFAEVFEFWFDRGVEGFRVDAISPVGKHPELPDAPPVPEGTGMLQVTWENPYTVFRPEGHDVWRQFRATIDTYMDAHPDRDLTMVAEAYMNGRPDLMAAFVNDEQFHQAFAFDLLLSPWDKTEMERAIGDTLDLMDAGSTPTWTLNNHDVQRVVTRLGRDNATDPSTVTNNALESVATSVDIAVGLRRARAMITLAMAMPGSIYLYMGEELGLPEVLDMPDDRRQDPVFITTNGERLGRDGCRVPLPWTDDPSTNFGFSASPDASEPWLPQPEWWGEVAVDVVDQQDDATLDLYRELIAARRELAVPEGLGAMVLDLGDGLVAVRRGKLIAVTNVTATPIALDSDHDEGIADAMPVFASEPDELHTPGVIPPDSTIWFSTP